MKASALLIGFSVILTIILIVPQAQFEAVDHLFTTESRDWIEEQQLTESRGDSSHPSIGIDDTGDLHIAWADERDGMSHVYYAQVDKEGKILVPETRMTNNNVPSDIPALDVGSGGEVGIAFVDGRNGNWNIFFAGLDHTGVQTVQPVQVSDIPLGANAKGIINQWNPGGVINGGPMANGNGEASSTARDCADPESFAPSIAIDDGGINHIVWSDARQGNFEIYYASVDWKGQAVSGEIRLTESERNSHDPVIQVGPYGQLHVMWAETDGNVQILRYMQMTKHANINVNERILTASGSDIDFDMLVDNEGFIHVAYSDTGAGKSRVYYMRLDITGTMDLAPRPVTTYTVDSHQPAMTKIGDAVQLVFTADIGTGTEKLYHMIIDDEGTSSLPHGVAPDSWNVMDPEIEAGSGVMYLVWSNGPEGAGDIYISQSNIKIESAVESNVVKTSDSPIVNNPTTSAAIGGLALLGVAFATDVGRWAWGAALAPFYSRLSRDQLLKHTLRGRIYKRILETPGITFTEIMKILELKNGVLAYHLSTLEREEIIVSRRDGIFRRYYPKNGHKIPQEIKDMIIDTVYENPGITQSKLARILKKSRQVVNYHIKHLVASGHIRVLKTGRKCKCYIRAFET
jgi:DNA-binding MarR family transcriptional regulator